MRNSSCTLNKEVVISKNISFNRNRGRVFDKTRINTWIKVPQVRLIDDEGNQLGVVDTHVGLNLAREKGLDIVEVSPTSKPPVCRIMDYSKYKYEQEKKRKLAKKKQHVTHIKEMRFKLRIENHDYQVKLKSIKEFLGNKDKVRILLRFRGRENAHKELGVELFNRIANDVSALGEMETSPKAMGRTVSVTIAPKAAEPENEEKK